MQFALTTAFVALAGLVSAAVGETHTVHFDNRCGFGTPRLIQGGIVLSNGEDYTTDGPLISAIAYLQVDGRCGFNGENCTLVETTLQNGGSGSETDISLIPPHEFSVPTGFGYYNGCDGAGADCLDPDCEAQRRPVPCTEDNVNLAITFCF